MEMRGSQGYPLARRPYNEDSRIFGVCIRVPLFRGTT